MLNVRLKTTEELHLQHKKWLEQIQATPNAKCETKDNKDN